MGIYIKGMKMPKSCIRCKLTIEHNNYLYCNCPASITSGDYVGDFKTEKHPDCTLIEIPTPHGDLISRQAAIDALDQIFDRCEEIEAHLPEGDPDRTGYKMYPDYMTVWKYLHQLPSAKPKCGRWIEGADGCVFCSECGIEWLSDSAKYYKYCPICGARMEASDD